MDANAFANPFKTELVEDAPEIIMTRVFDAPLELVWAVWTRREHVAYWWGWVGSKNEVVEYDVRKGGKWKIVSTDENGVFTMFGTYLDVQPRTLIRNTFVVEGMNTEDDRFYEEHTFEERGGKTHYRSRTKMESFEQRQALIDSGMEYGANVTMVKFDELLQRLKAGK